MSVREVALDTNVFLLFLVGMYDKSAIERNRRLKAFDATGFEMLCDLVSRFDKIVVTPGCLAETTNLLDFDKSTRGKTYARLAELLEATDTLDERYVNARQVVQNPCYMWLGITDSTYVELAKRGIPVITADLQLYLQAVSYASESVNFAAYTLN